MYASVQCTLYIYAVHIASASTGTGSVLIHRFRLFLNSVETVLPGCKIVIIKIGIYTTTF